MKKKPPQAADTEDETRIPETSPHWYKNAVIYELHVRAFFDSNGDGFGDFKGLTQRLSYLKDLGITTLWLLPFYPSPLRTQGHDVTDFKDVHPNYGTLADFREFLREAHRQNIRVITDMVIAHTSTEHPWFQAARRAKPSSPQRDFYVWSDTTDKFKDARIIYRDFESSNWTWDPIAGQYYWHRFFSHQANLNFDNPKVHEAITDIVDFWFRMGVDGLRLQALPYLYNREETSCENLPETHAFLKKLRKHVDRHFKGRVLLTEAKQWPEDVVSYFGKGDECHMAFNSPLMPRMFMAAAMEDRFPIIDVLSQLPSIPDNCQWANYLRDHDDLSLEMVTEEERDYMYRSYAPTPRSRVNLGIRRRLAPLLGNNRRKIELLNGILFSLPGTPAIYYGDEIGMGDNIYLSDRNGIRTPLQWSANRNAGFSRATNSQMLYLPVIVAPEYHYENINIEAQQSNPNSLLTWMKRLIQLYKSYEAFSRGSLKFLAPENRKILAFTREHKNERILVLANLSSQAQFVELDLSDYEGFIPVELFGGIPFPKIGSLPYFVTLNPHSFYWFSLESQESFNRRKRGVETRIEPVKTRGIYDKGFCDALWEQLTDHLPAVLPGRRWFGGKSRTIKNISVVEKISFPNTPSETFIGLFTVEYAEGSPETYAIPLMLAWDKKADDITKKHPGAVIFPIIDQDHRGVRRHGLIYDATISQKFCSELLKSILDPHKFHGIHGELVGVATRNFRVPSGLKSKGVIPSQVLKAEQSNTSINFDGQLMLKLFRKLEEGVNPDVEIGRFLTEQSDFKNTPKSAGTIQYVRENGEAITIGSVHSFVPNEGDAWKVFMNLLTERCKKLIKQDTLEVPLLSPSLNLTDLATKQIPASIQKEFAPFTDMAQLLGQRTIEMHLALAKDTGDAAFSPEPFTIFYQRSLYQSMRRQTDVALNTLRQAMPGLPEHVRQEVQRLLRCEEMIYDRFRKLLDHRITAQRTRTHGDFHLGQVLYSRGDFIIIDFEGEPARSISERKFKRSPLRDVAGMLRSFHYASHVALSEMKTKKLEPWLTSWHGWVCAAYLTGYFSKTGEGAFLPGSEQTVKMLLDVYLLEKALYELIYEINNRPDWVKVPLSGIMELLEAQP